MMAIVSSLKCPPEAHQQLFSIRLDDIVAELLFKIAYSVALKWTGLSAQVLTLPERRIPGPPTYQLSRWLFKRSFDRVVSHLFTWQRDLSFTMLLLQSGLSWSPENIRCCCALFGVTPHPVKLQQLIVQYHRLCLTSVFHHSICLFVFYHKSQNQSSYVPPYQIVTQSCSFPLLRHTV